jgi:hypothetical protein
MSIKSQIKNKIRKIKKQEKFAILAEIEEKDFDITSQHAIKVCEELGLNINEFEQMSVDEILKLKNK